MNGAIKRNIGISMITAGVLIISWAFYARLITVEKQKAMIEAFNAAVESYQSNPESSDAADKAASEPDAALKRVIGVMYIPRIDLQVAVVDGVDVQSLKRAVGHFKDTAMPGQNGNCAISGHRSYTYNQFFNRLDEVEPGDEITIQTKTGSYKYEAFQKKITEPDDISVLKNTSMPTLTLITCHPERSSAQRLVITCKLKQ